MGSKKIMAKKKKQTANSFNMSIGGKWLPVIVFISVGILVFYPPFFRGLFFNKEIFITHIITAVVFLLVWADKIRRRDYSLLQTPLDWAVLAYAGAYLLSLLGAVHIGDAVYGVLRALNYFMVYWVVTQVIKNHRDFENILRIILAAGVAVAAIGILAATGYSNYPHAFDGRQIMSTLQYHNTAAAYLGVLSFIGITLWIRTDNIAMKVIYGISTYLMILVTLSAVSKGAWLIFIIGGLLLLFGMPGIYRIKSFFYLMVAFIAAFVISSKFVPVMTGENPSSGLSLVLWGFLLIIIGQALWEALVYINNRLEIKTRTVTIIVLLLITISIAIIGPRVEIPDRITGEFGQIGDKSDMSYVTRADFIRWGWAIVKDHPVVGTGAGGWEALYHKYQDYLFWTSETHNHFMQVWVESGTIGLIVYLAMWVSFLYLLFGLYSIKKRDGQYGADAWVLIWGTASAAMAFGAHSAIDFDLSLGAMCFLLWTLFALINSGYKIEKKPSVNHRPWIHLTISVVLAIVLLFFGSSYAVAFYHGQTGARLLKDLPMIQGFEQQEQLLQTALEQYNRATRLDALNAGYWTDQAYLYSLQYSLLIQSDQQQAKQAFEQAVLSMEKAERLKPYDRQIRSSLLNSAVLMGDIDAALRQAECSITANPNDMKAYLAMDQVLGQAIQYYVHNNQYDKAKDLAPKILELHTRLKQQQNRINYDRPYWQGEKLEASSQMQLNLGKAYYLQGEFSAAKDVLEPLVQDSALKGALSEETTIWYAVSMERSGNKARAQELVSRIDNDESKEIYRVLLNI